MPQWSSVCWRRRSTCRRCAKQRASTLPRCFARFWRSASAQVSGPRWSGAPIDVIQPAARDLLAIQKDDGGWAQLETMASDAHATGEALVAFRKGLEFLLRTQIDDGSLVVETRAVPIQACFESGFSYGVNQWVSAAATGWATTALALAK